MDKHLGINDRLVAADAGIASCALDFNPNLWKVVGGRPSTIVLTTGVDPTAAQYGVTTIPEGSLYWHPVDHVLRVFTSSAWATSVAATFGGTGTYTLTTGTQTWSGAGYINLGASAYIKSGTTPATTGILRVPTATYAAYSRNAANGANIGLIQANASDLIAFGANLASHTVAGELTVSTGGLTVTAGGLTVTAGGLTVTAGGATITAGGLTITAGDIVAAIGTAPATKDTAGVAGTIRIVRTAQYTGHIYVCSASGEWGRLAFATF